MRWLESQNINYEILSYEHKERETVDGKSAAIQLNEDFNQVFKTLVCQVNTKEYLVYMLPVTLELDFKKCAKVAGVKSIIMIPLNDLTKITGYVRGRCSPIGMKKTSVPLFMNQLYWKKIFILVEIKLDYKFT